MKTVLSTLALVLLFSSSSIFAAESVVIRESSTWTGVPITVDTTKHTYTVSGTVPADATNYYYSYPGYRCFREKRDFVGVNLLVFSAGVSGGSDIYCYPE